MFRKKNVFYRTRKKQIKKNANQTQTMMMLFDSDHNNQIAIPNEKEKVYDGRKNSFVFEMKITKNVIINKTMT